MCATSTFDFAQKPEFGLIEIRMNGGWGNLQKLRGFLDAESAKEAEFDDLTFSRINCGKLLERFVQRYQVNVSSWRRYGCFLQGYWVRCPSSFLRALGTRKIHQNTPHQFCRQSKEVGAISQLDTLSVDQSKVSFVDQRCSLKHVARRFPSHVSASKTVQFVIYERCQFI
jgi:hypothetical protein